MNFQPRLMLWGLGGLSLASSATAQNPDVRIRLDVFYSYESSLHSHTQIKFYDPLGRLSTVGLTMYLEPGFKAYLSQKLQQIENDPDSKTLDEAYVEDEHIWRVGRQYLPFGKYLVRECVLGVRGESTLILNGTPVTAAYCDAGSQKQRGFVARFGGNLGASVALGQHFGINSTALALVRKVDSTPGAGFGWGQMFGVDYSASQEKVNYTAEIVSLGRGHTTSDKDTFVGDVAATYIAQKGSSWTVGLTRDTQQNANFYRLAGSFTVVKNLIIEPMVRMRNGNLFDFSLTTHIKF